MSNLSRWFAVALIALSSACASKPKKTNPIDAPLTDAVRKDLEKYCGLGNPFACYRLGSDLDDHQNWGEARVWFGKACDQKLAAACSEASVLAMTKLNQKEEAVALARKSCDLNDTLGCYNQGCFECVAHNDPAAALKSLDLAVKLGYRNRESLRTDPDLECVRKSKGWDAFMKRIPEEGDSKVTHRYALSTGMRHLYHPKLRYSYAVVPGFHIQYSVSGTMVFDDAGSRVLFTGSHTPFSAVSETVLKTEMIGPGETEIHKELGQVNGMPALVRVVKGTSQGMEYIASTYVTGDERYTATAQSSYLASYHSTYGQLILQSSESIVLDPRGPPGPAELPYTNAAQIGSYKYAGLRSGSPLWTPSGVLPARDKSNPFPDTLVVNSVIFTKEEPFNEATFQRIWTLVAGQSAIETEKFDPRKIVKRPSVKGGNESWSYLAPAKQLDGANQRHPIRMEVGLVRMPHTAPIGEIGYFWARVIKSRRSAAEVASDTGPLSSLKLRPEVFKEVVETPVEEPDITAPSSVGNGAIPAS